MLKDAFYPTHLYKVARENGYKTGLTGKNHTFLRQEDTDFWRMYELASGWIAPNAPKEYYDFETWLQSLRANLALEPNPFPVELQHPYRIVSDAMEFIDGAGDQPFLLQIGFSEPHDPEQVPTPYWDMFPPDSVPDRCAGPEALKQMGYRAQWLYGHQESGFPSEKNWRRYKSNYLGMLRLLDDQLARLQNFLDEKKLTQNTILVYSADHGDYLMDYGLGRKGVGMPESLARIPMVWGGRHQVVKRRNIRVRVHGGLLSNGLRSDGGGYSARCAGKKSLAYPAKSGVSARRVFAASTARPD